MKVSRFNIKLYGSAMALFCITLALAMAGYTWFCSIGGVKKVTEDLKIDKPPIIYILDSDGADMYQLSLSGLKAGETKQVIICISQTNPVKDDSPVSSDAFRIAIAHTNNLGAVYDLYAANAVPVGTEGSFEYTSQPDGNGNYTTGNFTKDTAKLIWEDKSNDGNNKVYGDNYSSVVNQVTYQVYINDNNSNKLQYGSSSGTGILNPAVCKFYLLEVTVPNGSTADSKEVDMIYILARGGS